MKAPRIAFCTTCKNRTQHLKLTLPKNLAQSADYENAVFVIVNYGSEDDLTEWLIAEHRAEIESGRIVLYSHPNVGPFRMAHAKNIAHRAGIREGADILVNLDADNYMGTGFASYVAAEYISHGADFFMWASMVKGVLPRGISGRIVVPSHLFLKAGGYDERFSNWGPDDKDFNQRLRRLGFEAREIDIRFLDGVRHSDKMRFREYPHVRCEISSDELPIIDESDATVVNFGRIGLGEVWRNGCQVQPLEALPTRIFGIGMHKTGTTSLHSALKILGFDSAHWTSAHWAKSIWGEMHAFDKSVTLERTYALTDLPFNLLYKRLDAAYPGSKFILTTRDENQWLRSVEDHWSYAHNKFRKQWDTDPFTHFIHKKIYGQKNFDATVFLDRFRRHNTEVREYFKDRPQDLLEIDIGDARWLPLCLFLEKPMPDVPYPRSNMLTQG